jgi:hypothetical protein
MSDKSNNKKIVGFRKFSDIKTESKKIEEIDPSMPLDGFNDSDIPMNPNVPNKSRKIEKPASRKNLMPQEQDIELSNDDEIEDFGFEEGNANESKSNIETFGRVAKFPKNIKASKAYNFLENVKVPKKSIWYIMVEKQDNELQMVKYNVKEGVDLGKFVNELKSYYINKYKSEPKLQKLVESIYVDGNDKYSMVKNIPLVTVEGRKLITIITEDLIRLLSK